MPDPPYACSGVAPQNVHVLGVLSLRFLLKNKGKNSSTLSHNVFQGSDGICLQRISVPYEPAATGPTISQNNLRYRDELLRWIPC